MSITSSPPAIASIAMGCSISSRTSQPMGGDLLTVQAQDDESQLHQHSRTLAHLSLSPSILQTTYVAQRATKHISVFNFSCLNCSTLGVDQLLCKYGMAHPPFQLLYFYRGFRSKLQGTLGSPKGGFSITIDVHVTWSCSAGTRSNCLPHLQNGEAISHLYDGMHMTYTASRSNGPF